MKVEQPPIIEFQNLLSVLSILVISLQEISGKDPHSHTQYQGH
jgi:hypothetical protein